MRVLFIAINTELITMTTLPLGLACVATATQRAEHQVKLVDLSSKNDSREIIRESIETFHTDIIAIGVRNIDNQSMVDTHFLLDQVKDVVADCRTITEAPIILGGAGYSIYPESILAYLEADMGIGGEGEVVFPALLDHLQHGEDLSKLPGLYLPGKKMTIKKQFTENLDALLFLMSGFGFLLNWLLRMCGYHYRPGVDARWTAVTVRLHASKAECAGSIPRKQ